MGKAFVQHTVGNEVAQLIRMPFRNRFGGIKLIHGNQPFGRFASAQIGMKECRQATAFLIK